MGIAAGIVALLVCLAPLAAAQTYLPAEEAHSLDLLNGKRAEVGRSALPRHPALDDMARAQSVRMADRGDIYHNPNLSSDADATGLDWRRVGENVGVGPDVPSIHDAFVASSSHYENMIYPTYNAIGVGIVPGSDGRIYVTHVFAEVAAPAPAPQPAPAAPVVQAPAPASAPPAPSAQPARPAPRPQPVLAAVPTPEPRSPQPNALTGGVVNLRLVFGVTDPAAGDDQIGTAAGLGYRSSSPGVFTLAVGFVQRLFGAA